jgi:hypothetical protein
MPIQVFEVALDLYAFDAGFHIDFQEDGSYTGYFAGGTPIQPFIELSQTAAIDGALAATLQAVLPNLADLAPNDAGACLAQYLQTLESQLASGHECVCGELTITDFSVAHVLWHLRRAGPPAELLLAPFGRVLKWHDCMLAFGHGHATAMSSEQALQTAAQATGHEVCSVTPEPGLTLGQTVSVAAVDYGHEASWGELVGLNALEVVIARSDARAGRVHVHFPRVGFRITPA